MCGPNLEVTGTFEDVSPELVPLRLSETRTKLVPLLQKEAIDGVEVPTAARLERPRVDGVVREKLARKCKIACQS